MTPEGQLSTCSFCLCERPTSDLSPLGPEISKDGQWHAESICQRCHDRLTPPTWVARNAICTRLWFASSDWRQNARLAGSNQATQRLLIKLAWRASGGSEGEAVEA